mgnify:FL=1
MIKRTSKKYINSVLKSNKDWKVLDLGCGYSANEYADTICDIQNLSDFYKGKNFVKLTGQQLPFGEDEFDFIIASHVIEHVEDPKLFINELQRVSKKGYIELPTKLEDNLVFENKKDHLWHMDFDDVNSELLISKKIQIFEPVVTVSTIQKLREYFRNSFVIELYWEKEINYKFSDEVKTAEKFNLLTLLRKFISKKLRTLFN